jgi:hypothetical protein
VRDPEICWRPGTTERSLLVWCLRRWAARCVTGRTLLVSLAARTENFEAVAGVPELLIREEMVRLVAGGGSSCLSFPVAAELGWTSPGRRPRLRPEAITGVTARGVAWLEERGIPPMSSEAVAGADFSVWAGEHRAEVSRWHREARDLGRSARQASFADPVVQRLNGRVVDLLTAEFQVEQHDELVRARRAVERRRRPEERRARRQLGLLVGNDRLMGL